MQLWLKINYFQWLFSSHGIKTHVHFPRCRCTANMFTFLFIRYYYTEQEIGRSSCSLLYIFTKENIMEAKGKRLEEDIRKNQNARVIWSYLRRCMRGCTETCAERAESVILQNWAEESTVNIRDGREKDERKFIKLRMIYSSTCADWITSLYGELIREDRLKILCFLNEK